MGEPEKVEQQQTQQPASNTPEAGQGRPELSDKDRTIIGLKAELKRYKEKVSLSESVSREESDEAPSGEKLPWVDQREKDAETKKYRQRIRQLESQVAQTQLANEKTVASRDHGIPDEYLGECDTSESVLRKIAQWYKDVKEGIHVEKKEVVAPKNPERLEGSVKTRPSPSEVRNMTAEEFERLRQSLRVKNK